MALPIDKVATALPLLMIAAPDAVKLPAVRLKPLISIVPVPCRVNEPVVVKSASMVTVTPVGITISSVELGGPDGDQESVLHVPVLAVIVAAYMGKFKLKKNNR